MSPLIVSTIETDTVQQHLVSTNDSAGLKEVNRHGCESDMTLLVDITEALQSLTLFIQNMVTVMLPQYIIPSYIILDV